MQRGRRAGVGWGGGGGVGLGCRSTGGGRAAVHARAQAERTGTQARAGQQGSYTLKAYLGRRGSAQERVQQALLLRKVQPRAGAGKGYNPLEALRQWGRRGSAGEVGCWPRGAAAPTKRPSPIRSWPSHSTNVQRWVGRTPPPEGASASAAKPLASLGAARASCRAREAATRSILLALKVRSRVGEGGGRPARPVQTISELGKG